MLVVSASCGNEKNEQQNETQSVEETENKPQRKTSKLSMLNASESMSNKIKFLGRAYYNPNNRAYCFDYSLSGFEINFKGTGVNATLFATVNENPNKDGILYVYVDNSETPTKQIDLHKAEETVALAEGLEFGEHTLKVIKRTDISYSSAGLKSLEITGEDAEILAKPEDKNFKIEFIGDSITSGDGLICKEDEYIYDTQHQDAIYSYAKLVSDYFDADYSLVSRCGMGLVWNSGGKSIKSGAPTVMATYDKVSSPFNGAVYDFSKFQPDLIIINIGTNDQKQFESTPSNVRQFRTEYVELLKLVRKNNPNAKILCCYGSMTNESIDFKLEEVIEKANAEGINDIYYMRTPQMTKEEFGYTIGGHPSIEKQKFDAENYYIPKIKEIMGIQ